MYRGEPMTKNEIGRPSTYNIKYCKEIEDFFDVPHTIQKTKSNKDGDSYTTEEPNTLPTFERFAVNIGVHRETLRNWCDKHDEFFVAYKKAQNLQKDMLVDLGLKGLYNSTFTIFTAKNITDMKDKQYIDETSKRSIVVSSDADKEALEEEY